LLPSTEEKETTITYTARLTAILTAQRGGGRGKGKKEGVGQVMPSRGKKSARASQFLQKRRENRNGTKPRPRHPKSVRNVFSGGEREKRKGGSSEGRELKAELKHRYC